MEWFVFVSFSVVAECRGRRRKVGCKNAWVTEKKWDDVGCDKEGWDERGTAVGGTLRNVWKVSVRRWTVNPAHHSTIPSPTALISAPLQPPCYPLLVMFYKKATKGTWCRCDDGRTHDQRSLTASQDDGCLTSLLLLTCHSCFAPQPFFTVALSAQAMPREAVPPPFFFLGLGLSDLSDNTALRCAKSFAL